jgi:hypothetical protein
MAAADNVNMDDEGFMTVSYNNKRQRTDATDAQTINEQCVITSPNPFRHLQVNEPEQSDKTDRPPPIIISNVLNYDTLRRSMIGIIGNNFTCSIGRNQLTIRTVLPADYRKLIHYLKDNNAEYHTFQPHEEKPYRVVLRGLHFSTSPLEIKHEIEMQGHKVRRCVNVISRDKVPLPLFFVDIEPALNNTEIFKIKSILHCRVNVEEPRQRREIPQCARCQGFQHTKSYCNKHPKCVRCGQPHLTSECKKTRDTKATCANCGCDHPANYKGCLVYQSLQHQSKRSHNYSQQGQHGCEQVASPPAPTNEHFPALQQVRDPRIRQQLVKQLRQQNQQHDGPHQREQQQQQQHNKNNQQQEQQQDKENMQRQFRSTYAAQVRGDHNIPDSSPDTITNLLSTFITEIKSLVMPLMSLLTQLTQVLLTQNASRHQ